MDRGQLETKCLPVYLNPTHFADRNGSMIHRLVWVRTPPRLLDQRLSLLTAQRDGRAQAEAARARVTLSGTKSAVKTKGALPHKDGIGAFASLLLTLTGRPPFWNT